VAGLEDRSSRPRRSPGITARALVTAVQQLRTDHGVPAWFTGRALGVPRSTVSAWIRRLGLQRVRVVAPALRRYEWPTPATCSISTSSRSSASAAWGIASMAIAANRPATSAGSMRTSPVDDHSRIAYVEVLPDQQGATCAALLRRALAWWAHRKVTVQRVLTDNGSRYLSVAFRAACDALAVGHRRTRPYTPAAHERQG
jgi:hypothetical protein